MHFSAQKYSQYVKMEQHKKMLAHNKFKVLVEQIVDKQNWKERWENIKPFINNGRLAYSHSQDPSKKQ